MNSPRNITPPQDTELRAKFRSKDWIPISARFQSKCKHCGGSVSPGAMIVWNKALSKVMHYNPCAMEWLETQPASGSATTSAPQASTVAVSIGGKKAAPVKVEPPPSAAPEKSAAAKFLEEAKQQEEEEARKQEEARKEETAQKLAGMASKQEKKNVNEPRKPSFARITLKPGAK